MVHAFISTVTATQFFRLKQVLLHWSVTDQGKQPKKWIANIKKTLTQTHKKVLCTTEPSGNV